MEVVNILPTPVLIVKCPFHDKIKQTILDEIEEQKVNQLSYNVNSKELKHVGHYSVYMMTVSMEDLETGVNNRQNTMQRK